MSSYLGQNFLVDTTILQRIAQTIEEFVNTTHPQVLIEIGPGKGALTQHIQDLVSQTLLIEYDHQMVDYLQSHKILSEHTTIIQQDILEWDDGGRTTNDESSPKDGTDKSSPILQGGGMRGRSLVVGNLPYYITSPILRKFFEAPSPIWLGGVFLIQKEVAEKLAYDSPKRSYLRWLINFAYRIEYCFDVPAEAFDPAPRVTSAVIRVVPKSQEDIPQLDFEQLKEFLDLYHQFARKTLGKSAKILAKRGEGSQFDISETKSKRLEELTRDDLITMLP